MNFILIAPTDIQRQTLHKALERLDITPVSYAAFTDIEAQNEIDAVLIYKAPSLAMEGIEKVKNLPCFIIHDTEEDMDLSALENKIQIFKTPIRLGHLLQSIQFYINQREQRAALQPIKMGEFILDPKTGFLKRGNENIKLTEKEQEMLIFLQTQKGTQVSRKTLLDNVWGYAQGVETHTLETHIYRLRQKIEQDPAAPKFLMTDEKGYFLNF